MKTDNSTHIYLLISGFVFLIVALAHILRVAYHIALIMGSIQIPMSLSIIAAIICLIFSVWAFWLAIKK